MSEAVENIEDDVDNLEKEVLYFCNLIPVNSWGFDDEVKESLKMRKHSLVNRQLSKKERKSMSAQQKQQLAKGLGLVPNTVQEVLEWMSNSKQHSKVQPQKAVSLKRPTNHVEKKEKSDLDKNQKQEIIDSGEDEDEESDNEETGNEVEEPKAKKQKTVAASNNKIDDDNECEIDIKEPNGSSDDNDDSTDEESEVPKKIKQNILKSSEKVGKEIRELEDDEDNESPEIKRQIALLRLQKKLKEMKTERKGKGAEKSTAALAMQLAEEKRLKRRESKLKLKQRRAAEKIEKSEVKEEAADCSENSVKTVDKKASGLSFNNLKFEIKEDKQRGKKQRTAKKDRALKLTGRDYKSLIAKVEETKATIAKVREADPHKATIMEDELKWEKTLKRAAGGKVKDNLEMLKKALVKKNKMKDKKKQTWENREKKVEGEKQLKQEKRKKNLQKRIDSVKKRKMNKLRNKGRIL